METQQQQQQNSLVPQNSSIVTLENNQKIDNRSSLANPHCLLEYYEIAKKLN